MCVLFLQSHITRLEELNLVAYEALKTFHNRGLRCCCFAHLQSIAKCIFFAVSSVAASPRFLQDASVMYYDRVACSQYCVLVELSLTGPHAG